MREQIEGHLGKDGIAGRAALGMKDMDPHVFPVNVFIAEMAEFPNAETGGIHDGDHGLLLQIGNGGNEAEGIFLRRDVGQIFIELTQGKLGIVPRQVKDIQGKETQLGDTSIDGPVGQIPFPLEPPNKIPKFRPGNLFRPFEKE